MRLLVLGDTDPMDDRRATAVGILADPQQALDPMSGDGEARQPVGQAARSARRSIGPSEATTFVHVDADHLEAGGVIERLGAATTARRTSWLARCGDSGGVVRMRPVLPMGRRDAVDTHDPAGWLREPVPLRDAHCGFPGCRRDSRSCDRDHVIAFVPVAHGGPPGQTRPDNLAPPCRLQHRMKTHASFIHRRLDDGTFAGPARPGDHDLVTVPPRHAPRHP